MNPKQLNLIINLILITGSNTFMASCLKVVDDYKFTTIFKIFSRKLTKVSELFNSFYIFVWSSLRFLYNLCFYLMHYQHYIVVMIDNGDSPKLRYFDGFMTFQYCPKFINSNTNCFTNQNLFHNIYSSQMLNECIILE